METILLGSMLAAIVVVVIVAWRWWPEAGP
jgi:hypothetical protein